MLDKGFITLGIESSCDETSAAVLRGPNELLSNIVSSQEDIHALFGGVVPEIAARKHAEVVNHIIKQALDAANVGFGGVDLIAVTVGPGLIVSLVVGVSAAKALATVLKIPVVGVNHLEGHILSNIVTAAPAEFPAVCLLVSGGHTEIVLVEEVGKYRKLGGTVDDAAGEAFDKVSRLLGLGYPGGPKIQKAAESGNPEKVRFPRPMMKSEELNFSFSGLKTAVLNFMKNMEKGEHREVTINDVAASFQEAAIDVLVEKTLRAAEQNDARLVWLAGGVAANRPLRDRLAERCRSQDINFSFPNMMLCTDNAGMIAKAGYEIYCSKKNILPLSPLPSLTL